MGLFYDLGTQEYLRCYIYSLLNFLSKMFGIPQQMISAFSLGDAATHFIY